MLAIFDIDGTLAQATPERLKLIQRKEPDWQAFLAPELVATDTVIVGAKEGYNKIKELGARIVFLTGRNEGLRKITLKWLKENIDPDIKTKQLIMRPLKSLQKPTEYKEGKLNKLLSDMWAEDKWEGKPAESAIAFDDDLYMMPVYHGLGIVALHAPDCWGCLCPIRKDLPEETNWRK